MSTPKISIIVHVYKVEKYLRRCLDSIVAQTFTDWECILVDDGSTDGSYIICEDYSRIDSRFIVFHQENRGVSSARNIGIEKSKGEFICFIDADDWIKETYLEQLLEQKKYPMVVGGYERFGVVSKTFKLPFKEVDVMQDLGTLWNIDQFSGWVFLYTWGKLFKSSVIKENNIRFNKGMKYSEDNCFVIDFLCCISQFVMIGTSDYMYYLQELVRPKKFKMKFEDYIMHIKKQKESFDKLEAKCHKSFDNLKSNIYHRFFKSFAFYLSTIDNYAEFKSQLTILKRTSIPKFDGKWKHLYCFYKYMPVVFSYIVNKIIKNIK